MANLNFFGFAPVTGLSGLEWVLVQVGGTGLSNVGSTMRAQVSQFNIGAGTTSPQAANTFFAGPTTGGSSSPGFRALVLADLPTGGAGQLLQGAASGGPTYTPTPQLGASGVLGSITMGNATSGLLTLRPATGALSASVISVPAGTDTLVCLALAQTLSAKTFSDSVICTGEGGVGYGAGAGGTVTQLTDKTTAFVLSTVTGQITLAAGALASLATVSSTWTNSVIAPNDVVIISHRTGGTRGAYVFDVAAGVGTATLFVTNVSGGTLNEQPVLQYVIIKGATA